MPRDDDLTEIFNFYAALVESTDDAIVAKDTHGNVLAWNPAAERLFGYAAKEMIGNSIRRLLPDDRQHEEDLILSRIRAGERVGQFFTKRLHKDGRLLDVSVTVSPVHDTDGNIVGASKIARDIEPYLEDQRRIIESRERFETMADNIAPFAWMANPDGHIFWYNKRWYEYTGTTLADMEGWSWMNVHHPDHVDRVVAKFSEALAEGDEWEDVFPLRSAQGEYRWFLSRAKPIRGPDGAITRWFGTNTDITEQREQAEQIRLLLMEVNHRSKNMLSTIQALARRSLRDDGEALERFHDRVRSLAVNQDILVRREWRDVPLDELIALQLAFVADAPDRVRSAGPVISLDPRSAEMIGMALHELATNSLKYGSLSLAGGHVDIDWEVDREADRFVISWRETGGPEVVSPDRTGFGMTLICDVPRNYFGSDVQIDFDPTGIRWRLACPLRSVERSDTPRARSPV